MHEKVGSLVLADAAGLVGPLTQVRAERLQPSGELGQPSHRLQVRVTRLERLIQLCEELMSDGYQLIRDLQCEDSALQESQVEFFLNQFAQVKVKHIPRQFREPIAYRHCEVERQVGDGGEDLLDLLQFGRADAGDILVTNRLAEQRTAQLRALGVHRGKPVLVRNCAVGERSLICVEVKYIFLLVARPQMLVIYERCLARLFRVVHRPGGEVFLRFIAALEEHSVVLLYGEQELLAQGLVGLFVQIPTLFLEQSDSALWLLTSDADELIEERWLALDGRTNLAQLVAALVGAQPERKRRQARVAELHACARKPQTPVLFCNCRQV